MVIKCLAVIIGLSALFSAEAQVINAASCNASDVQAAFKSVTAGTTTVNIPACPSGTSWTTGVTLTVPSGSTTLSILGAGSLTTTGGGDQTVIIDNLSGTDNALSITTAGPSSYFRLAGLTIQGGSGAPGYNGAVQIKGYSQNVRVDHAHFNGLNEVGLAFYLGIYGVTDHNIFTAYSGGGVGAFVEHNDFNGTGEAWGDGSWSDASSFGSNKFMFFEDNTFNNSSTSVSFNATDCMGAGREVLRYNTINNAFISAHDMGGRLRGCREYEIYHNTMTFGTNPDVYIWPFAVFLRMGTHLIWNNTTTGYVTLVTAKDDRSENLEGFGATPNNWGFCGTTYGPSNWDQNTVPSSGYPCLDQVGRGKGDLLTGNFPNACDQTSGQCSNSNYNGSWANEALEPVYEWGDSYTPVPNNSLNAVFSSNEPSIISQNRDFYLNLSNTPPFSPISFNGTSGVGTGLLSARPSTCTPMVAYWATDSNTLYQCSAKNTWTAYYTPYTYPHPLTQGAGGDPLAPTGLQATVN